MEHIKSIVEKAAAELETGELKLSEQALNKYREILNKLASGKPLVIAGGINEMNQILSVVPLVSKENSYAMYANSKLFEYLIAIRNALGKPLPIVYPMAGFTQAFAVNGPMKSIADEADFSLWSVSKRFKFSKQSDLLLYKMICGKPTASFDKTKVLWTDADALSPQFDPPTILNLNAKRDGFCQQIHTTNSLYAATLGGKSLQNFLIENLNYDIIGNYQNKENKSGLDAWWDNASKKAVTAEFAGFDAKFRDLTVKAQNNIFNHKSYYKWATDHLNQSKYLQANILDQYKTETELYLQLIQRALTPIIAAKTSDDRNYLQETVNHSKSDTFQALNGTTYLEVIKISDLMNSYYPFILQDKVEFKSYIAHSKKIDTAINDVLVAAGLKTLEKPVGEKKEVDILGDPAETGTETSDNVYKDVELKSLTLRQKVVIAAVRGLRQVESEVRRFIRMKVMLAKGLEIDSEQFRSDFSNQIGGQQESTKKRNQRGQ